MVSTADTRGQLLLVGGIAIAIVFLLSIILTNSLVVTTYTATPESADRIEEVEDRETAVRQDLTTVAAAVRNNTTFSNFNSTFNTSLQNYTRYRTRVSGSQSGVYINATLNATASNGGYIRSTPSITPVGFRAPTPPNPSDWVVAEDVDSVSVFNFTATGDSEDFVLTVEGDSGDVWELEITGSSGYGEVVVTPPGGTATTVCSSTSPGEDIDVDLVAGTCTVGGTTSTFATFESSVDEPYDEIAVQKGNKFRGYVWYASTGTFSNGKTGGYPATPAVDLTYTGPQTSYNRTIVLENET
ncbi:hypothetical protein [Haloarcula pelagica]|uniref:hypothetical protein n=1 Tax=Haloarcula pelagica TaxID=3033389 RepID=UPI0024C31B22|nr:hypothetical protein [Halomicroarcula sp. YJ-61-S]